MGIVLTTPNEGVTMMTNRMQSQFADREITSLDLNFNDSDGEMREILKGSRVIAIVGESNDHYYTSYQVAQYLKQMGYTVYPINPNIKKVDRDRSYPNLAAVPEPIDIVVVFRKPTHLGTVVEEAIAAGAKVLWAQLDVISPTQEPERRALEAGMKVVSDRCIRTEHERLHIPPIGELR